MSDLVLVESSVARACIVVDADASPTEHHAAQELQHHLELISGARLPIQSTAVARQPNILIGRSLATEHLPSDFDWNALGEDGALVRAVGQNLILAGATPRGSLYAVYQFLEAVLGCRWLTAKCSHIPQRATIAIDADLDIVHVPSFRYREPYFSVGDDADWAARNRVNGMRFPLDEVRGGQWKYAGFVHTFYPLLPPKEYFETHPEYFSEINGERTATHAQLCLTNPEVLEIVTENARAWLRRQPEARVLSVSQNDWHGNCQCANCRAMDEVEGSPSGTLVHFVNGVAERLEDEFPHVFIDTLAYMYTEPPPRHARPRRNVIIRLCHMTPACDGHPLAKCERNRSFVQYLQRWGEISPEVFIWDYFTNFAHYFLPFPNLDVICEDIPHFARAGVTGIFCQGDAGPQKGCGEFAELRAYLCARLLWNADLDGWKVIHEFLDLYYGAAAQPIRDYIELLHSVIRDKPVHFDLYCSLDQPFLTPEILQQSHALFDEAARRVANDAELSERVAVARLPLEYVYLKHNFRYAINGDKYSPANEELAQRAQRFFDLARAHGARSLKEGGRSLDDEAAGLGGYDLVALEAYGLKVVVAPEMGGRILSFSDTTGEDWMHQPEPDEPDYPITGGYEEYSQAQWHSPGWKENYSFEADASSVRLWAAIEDGLKLERIYRLESTASGPSLVIESSLSNTRDAARQVQLRCHPDFDPGTWSTASVEVRQQDGAVGELSPWQDESKLRGSLWLEGAEMPNDVWTLIRGKQRLTLTFQQHQIEKCVLDWDRVHNSVRLETYAKAQRLEPGASTVVHQRWTPSEKE